MAQAGSTYLWGDEKDTPVLERLIAGLVAQEQDSRPSKRARADGPGLALHTDPESEEIFQLAPQGRQACDSAVLALRNAALRLHGSLDDVPAMREKWKRSIGYYLFVRPNANKAPTFQSVLEDIRKPFGEGINSEFCNKLMMDLMTYFALFYFYQTSSIGVTDHKAVHSVRTMEELVEGAAEGFLVQVRRLRSIQSLHRDGI